MSMWTREPQDETQPDPHRIILDAQAQDTSATYHQRHRQVQPQLHYPDSLL